MVPASMGVNESWMRFFRVLEPVNTVFSITAPSVDCTAQSHRASMLDGFRFRLMDQSWDSQTRTFYTERYCFQNFYPYRFKA